MTALEGAESIESWLGQARALLEQSPWDDRAQAITMLAVTPPEALANGRPHWWLLLEPADVRNLDAPWREPLLHHRMRRTRLKVADLTVATLDGLLALLDGSSRRALEVRWEIAHAIPAHDPLGRFEGLRGAARRAPEGTAERTARTLYLQAYRALDVLPDTEGDAASRTIATGEAAGALARLSYLIEEGSHPPMEWLGAAAVDTGLGRRIRPWLDTFAPGIASQVLDEAAMALRSVMGERDWLRDPESHALRPPREGR